MISFCSPSFQLGIDKILGYIKYDLIFKMGHKMERQSLAKIYGLGITKIMLQIISGTFAMLLLYLILLPPMNFSSAISIALNILILSLIAFVVCLIGLGRLKLKPYLATLFGTISGIAVYLLFIYVLGTLGLAPS